MVLKYLERYILRRFLLTEILVSLHMTGSKISQLAKFDRFYHMRSESRFLKDCVCTIGKNCNIQMTQSVTFQCKRMSWLVCFRRCDFQNMI